MALELLRFFVAWFLAVALGTAGLIGLSSLPRSLLPRTINIDVLMMVLLSISGIAGGTIGSLVVGRLRLSWIAGLHLTFIPSLSYGVLLVSSTIGQRRLAPGQRFYDESWPWFCLALLAGTALCLGDACIRRQRAKQQLQSGQ